MRIVYVVCDKYASDKEDPEARIWTLSEDPNEEGWETDSGCSGYGLTKEKAEFYAACINEKIRGGAEQHVQGD